MCVQRDDSANDLEAATGSPPKSICTCTVWYYALFCFLLLVMHAQEGRRRNPTFLIATLWPSLISVQTCLLTGPMQPQYDLVMLGGDSVNSVTMQFY